MKEKVSRLKTLRGCQRLRIIKEEKGTGILTEIYSENDVDRLVVMYIFCSCGNLMYFCQ